MYGLNIADLGFSDLDLDAVRLGMTRDRQAQVRDTISSVFGQTHPLSSRPGAPGPAGGTQ